MTDLSVFRTYQRAELGDDDYPAVWHRNVTVGPDAGALDEVINAMLRDRAEGLDFRSGIKHLVRSEAGHRCVRCGHPYVAGRSSSEEAADERVVEMMAPILENFPKAGSGLATPRAAPKTNWSRCDAHCTHKGPVRVWVVPEDEPDDAGEWWATEALKPAGELATANRIEAPWRILTVHHLNGDKADCRWWNLTSLCQRCHLYIQRKVIMERVFPLEHSDWFKPYAAGWYAASYLGEELTRSETLSRLEELLALERLA